MEPFFQRKENIILPLSFLSIKINVEKKTSPLLSLIFPKMIRVSVDTKQYTNNTKKITYKLNKNALFRKKM